ncbi:hypothetical protein DFAR_760004 [Desulfarculales bacterium]
MALNRQRHHPADAILARLIHNAYKINPQGEPRKKVSKLDRRQDHCGIMQTPAAPCPSHPAHVTELDSLFQMECMAHFPEIRSTSASPQQN